MFAKRVGVYDVFGRGMNVYLLCSLNFFLCSYVRISSMIGVGVNSMAMDIDTYFLNLEKSSIKVRIFGGIYDVFYVLFIHIYYVCMTVADSTYCILINVYEAPHIYDLL